VRGPRSRPSGRRSKAGRVRGLVTLLTLLMTVDYADRGVLGAMAPTLKQVFSMSNTRYGLMSALFGVIGGLATLPAGWLVDRVRRTVLLGRSVAIWSVALLATGAASSYAWLLVSRMFLAVVAATVGPAFPSLAGDAVNPQKRGRFLGHVESGQLIGGAVGVAVGALAVSTVGWRWGFWVLVAPGVFLSFRLVREAEPARSSTHGQAAGWSLLTVFSYLLGRRTPLLVLLAVTAANAFLAGASSFAVIFAVGQYQISNAAADLALIALGLGALLGVVVGGRVSDTLVRSRHPAARLKLAGTAAGLAAVLWLPALLLRSLPEALPFLIVGAFFLASILPTLDAVRVEVVPASIRGRAEAARTLLRTLAEGGVPLLIGFAADHLAGGGSAGLQVAFLATLPALLAAAALTAAAALSYRTDEAAARQAE